ncbi:MAG: hypothetical protein H5U40_09295, partial [Polyangiaceae bacterium]|nr:hypothetical protein [Polyangiaceae bacterium]
MSPRKNAVRITNGRRRASALLLPWLASAAIGIVGCDDPPIDANTPPPRGVMEGTVLYVGPRPTCDYENGVPVRAHGRVILTLFAFDNPPPPEGSATSAANLIAIPGTKLFGNLAQSCLPEGGAPVPGESVTSSVDFTWPELALGITGPVEYRVQGFYDHDEDFNPFFE